MPTSVRSLISSIVRGGSEDLLTPASSWISSAHYDRRQQELTLSFLKGGSYTYPCSESTWKAFKAAPSKGRFTNLLLKRGYRG